LELLRRPGSLLFQDLHQRRIICVSLADLFLPLLNRLSLQFLPDLRTRFPVVYPLLKLRDNPSCLTCLRRIPRCHYSHARAWSHTQLDLVTLPTGEKLHLHLAYVLPGHPRCLALGCLKFLPGVIQHPGDVRYQVPRLGAEVYSPHLIGEPSRELLFQRVPWQLSHELVDATREVLLELFAFERQPETRRLLLDTIPLFAVRWQLGHGKPVAEHPANILLALLVSVAERGFPLGFPLVVLIEQVAAFAWTLFHSGEVEVRDLSYGVYDLAERPVSDEDRHLAVSGHPARPEV
jgi:hypothetical protein